MTSLIRRRSPREDGGWLPSSPVRRRCRPLRRIRRTVSSPQHRVYLPDCVRRQISGDALPALAAVPHVTQRNSAGYDGQFYAQLALYAAPKTAISRQRALDNPPYRAQRILFSWTAYVFGLGRPAWVVQVYAVQNIVVWGLLAILLLRWLPPTQLAYFAAWFACMFSAGRWILSAWRVRPKYPACSFCCWPFSLMEMKRPWLSASLLALGGLARETNLTGAPILVNRFPSDDSRSRQTGLGCSLLTIAPLLIWSLYVRSVYGPAH